jgi:hypothetical protein
VAAVIGGRAWSPASAEAATASDVPAYLLRSSYLDLSTPAFTASMLGNVTELTLDGVWDLEGSAEGKSVAGSEDAFSLAFSSKGQLDPGIHTFSHPDVGIFDFFIAASGNAGEYEVVVNRSVAAPKHAPKPPRKPATGDQGAAPAPGQSAGPAAPAPHDKTGDKHAQRKPHVRRISARRTPRGLVCDLALNSHADVKRATVWLSRGGLVVAVATERNLHGDRLAIKVPMAHRIRGGRYALEVATKDRHGHIDYSRAKIALQ